MSSASLRRSITSSDPRSPLQLSSLVTSFPQHQIITSFQTFQVSPMRYSPRRVNNSPIYARPATRAMFHDDASPSRVPAPSQSSSTSTSTPPRLIKPNRSRSSSIAKLLAPKAPLPPTESVPGMCPCGQSGRTIKHLVRDCPDLEAQRQRLMSRDPEAWDRSRSASPFSSLPQTTVEITAQAAPVQGAPKLVQIVRKRTRTLLGKVVDGAAGVERDERTAVI